MTATATRPAGPTRAAPSAAPERRSARRRRGPVLPTPATAALASAVVLLLVGVLSRGMPAAAVVPLVAVTALGLGLLSYAILVDRDLASPAALVALVVFAFYVARPIYLFGAGWWGAGASADLMPLDALGVGYAVRSLRVAVLAVGSLAGGYVLARTLAGRTRAPVALCSMALRRRRARFQLLVGAALAALLVAVLVARAGGPGAYLAALSRKSSFLAGGYWTTFLRLPLKATMLGWAAATFSHPGERMPRRDLRIVVALVAAVAGTDFLTGGRATLLVQTLLPVALLYHYLRRPIRPRTFALLLLAGLMIFVAVRVVTRDAQFAAGSGASVGLREQLETSVLRFPDTTIGGTDAVPFDSLMTLMAHESDPPLRGSTYADALNAPVPRALFPWKSDGGGNTWFTRTYYPRFYYPDKIETSLSLTGEAYANHRLAGVVIVPALFGLALGAGYSRFRRRRSPRWVLGYVAAIGTVVLALRGDAYQTTSSLLAVAVTILLASRIVRARPDAAPARAR